MYTELTLSTVLEVEDKPLTVEPTSENTPQATESLPQAPEAQPLKENDPYTISEDGHIVGHDGFVVPANFTEFYERFPNYLRSVVRTSPIYGSEADRQDWEGELAMHLMTLPIDSKMREPGYNGRPNGCTDRIQAFNPDLSHGASFPRFFYWLKTCLRNHLFSLARKSTVDPLMLRSIGRHEMGDTSEFPVDTSEKEFGYHQAVEFLQESRDVMPHLHRRILLEQFSAYVVKFNPELIAVMTTLAHASSYTEAQKTLCMTEKTLLRARARLRKLYECFTSKDDELPPMQRRSYRQRMNMGRSRYNAPEPTPNPAVGFDFAMAETE